MSEPIIRFPAVVYKVQTTIDGGIRLTLDLPETAIAQAAMLMEAKQQGIPLAFTATVENPQNRGNSRRGKRPSNG